jgi:hypothetical protein
MTGADRLRLGGALWLIAGVVCAGLFIVVFVGENLLGRSPGQSALVLAGAIAAFLTGGLLISRPGPVVVRWSSVLGTAWLIVFGSWLVVGLGNPDRGPLLSTGLITGFGVAGALVSFWSRRSGSTSERLA